MRHTAVASGSRRWLAAAAGATTLLVFWYVVAKVAVGNVRVLPTPLDVASSIWADPGFFRPHITQTAKEAGLGYLWGNMFAVALAIAFVQIPLVESVLMRVALTIYSIPIIAIGPILQVVLNGDQPKIAVAALLVFFPTLVATIVGLRSADAASVDLVRAFGGGSWKVLRKIRLRTSLPGLFAGLRVAAPTAVLGAIIGEYFGAEQGLGIAMVNAEAQLDAPRTWAIAVVSAALAASAYATIGLVERIAVPWAREVRL